MSFGLDYLNQGRKRFCLAEGNAYDSQKWYRQRMPDPRHDWYLKQWLRHFDKKQSDIVADLEWNKARVSLMASGKQPYTRDAVNELADYLNVRPHELLMHPDDAMRMRRLRNEMIRLAHESETLDAGMAPKKVSLG